MLSRLHIAMAVAQVEGWFYDHFAVGPPVVSSPNRPQRNWSPGNLTWAADRFPQDGMDGIYVKFADHLSGWAALENDIYAKLLHKSKDYPNGWTLRKLINVYCPLGHGSNDPDQYLKIIAGCLPDLKQDLPLRPIVLEEGRIAGPWKRGPGFGTKHAPDWKRLDDWCKSEVTR